LAATGELPRAPGHVGVATLPVRDRAAATTAGSTGEVVAVTGTPIAACATATAAARERAVDGSATVAAHATATATLGLGELRPVSTRGGVGGQGAPLDPECAADDGDRAACTEPAATALETVAALGREALQVDLPEIEVTVEGACARDREGPHPARERRPGDD